MGDFAPAIWTSLPRAYLNGAAGTEQVVNIDTTRGPVRFARAATTAPIMGVTGGSGVVEAGFVFYVATSAVEARTASRSENNAGYGGVVAFNATTSGDQASLICHGSAVGGFLFGQSQNRLAGVISNAVGGLCFGTFTARAVYFGANDTLSFSLGATSAHLLMARRLERTRAANTSSATTMTLPGNGDGVYVTNTNTIDGIVIADFQENSHVTLFAEDAWTMTHNSGAPGAGAVAVLLAGSLPFAAQPGDVLGLVYFENFWRETFRTVL